MKTRKLLIIIFLILGKYINAQNKIDQIFKLKTELSLISRGENFPDFEIQKDSLDIFLFTLHKSFSLDNFQKFTRFNNEKMSNLIRFLESKNWIHKINNQYKPTVFIADKKDGELLYKYAKPISRKITKSIIEKLPEIKLQFDKTEISKKENFQKWSFLILSDVLLDSWQIENVEKCFLKQENRPLRHGNHYYYKISENSNPEIESFGIYGNQTQQIKNKHISVYGNNRLNSKTNSTENLISKSDNNIFDEMAKTYLPDLLKILESEKKYSENIYSKLGYDKEITFEEFYIWWYHFVYTQTTNELNKKGILTIPKSGNFNYSIEN